MNNFTIQDIERLANYSLLESPIGNDWLDNIYQEQVGIIGHTNPYYRLFYQIAQILKPQFTVELGSWRAIAASHFAVGNPEGEVVTVDIHREDKVAQQLCIDAMNLLPNLTYINAWSWDAVDTIKAIDKPIDILFIDAWHDYQYAKKEWDLYSPLLSDNALVICDDITAGYNFEGMHQFWDEMPGEKFLNSEVHPGVPMGFVRFERGYNYPEIVDKYFPEANKEDVATNRTTNSTQSEPDKRITPTRGRPRKSRTA